MSMIHRQLLAQVMAAIDPVLEAGVAVLAPAAAPAVVVGLKAAEEIIGGAPAPVAAAAAAPSPAPGLAPAAPASPPAAAALSAAEVIEALLVTLQGLKARC